MGHLSGVFLSYRAGSPPLVGTFRLVSSVIAHIVVESASFLLHKHSSAPGGVGGAGGGGGLLQHVAEDSCLLKYSSS